MVVVSVKGTLQVLPITAHRMTLVKGFFVVALLSGVTVFQGARIPLHIQMWIFLEISQIC